MNINSSFFSKVSIINVVIGVGIFLIPTLFVFAQTVDNQAVFDDLSKLTGQEVTRLEQAKAICNVEQFITECAEIGKKYGLYTDDEQKQVDSVLLELKGKIVEDLKNCSTEECLINVANQLAKNLASKNPALGRQFDLTTAKVEEKKIIVETAKDIGVTVEQCRTMDPDTASIELLRSCARLAKDSRVQKYIPEDARRLAEVSDTSLDLQEALRKGEYQCGDNTLDGCGNFCLNPSQGTQVSGASTIPQVCRQIAVKFFGQDGVKQLESAYTKVNSASDYYKKKAEAVTFRTQDGRVLTNPVDIGRYMEGEMQKGNVDAIKSGMDFMVTRGFVQPEDRDFAIKMAQKAREQGSNFDFNSCERDPKSCQNFVPEDERGSFNAMEDIHRIMSEEMRKLGVPSPESCENNPQYGEACVKAARIALPRIEEIAKNFPQARYIIEDIRRHISFSDGAFDARKRAEEEFKKGSGGINIGDRIFNNFGDMEAFCRNNGSLCLTEAAKKGFINKDYATSRYENTFGPPRSTANGVFPPGQTPGFTAPGPGFGTPPGFNKEEALKQFQQWLDNPVGAPPVPTGGFPGGPYPPSGPYQPGGPYPQPFHQQTSFCPSYSPMPPCPTGQYRPESRDERGCFFSGACISISQPLPSQPTICPALYSVDSCPAGQKKVVSYSSLECGTFYSCAPDDGSQPQQPTCPSGQYWFVPYGGGAGYCKPYEQPTPCPAGQYWFIPTFGGAGYCKPNEQPTGACSPELTNLLGSGCHYMDNAYFDSPMTKYVFSGSNTVNECRANYIRNCTVGSSTTPTPTGQREQIWNSLGLRSYIRSDADPTRIEQLKRACTNVASGANVWLPESGNSTSLDFGMPSAEKCNVATSCAAGTYFNGTSCVSSTATTCPSGQYWSGTACVTNPSPTATTTATTPTTCPSGQYWYTPPGSSAGYCTSSTTTTSTDCVGKYGSGWHTMDSTSGTCFNASMTEYRTTNGTLYQCSATPTSGCSGSTTTTTTCSSGQTWNGTSCVASTNSYCPSFAHDMSGYCMINNDSTRCAEYNNASVEGNYTAAVCQQHSTTTTPTTTTTCASGQTWNGTSCVASTSTTCPSGQYWNGTACVTSTTTTTACNNNNICESGESSGSCPSDCGSTTTSGCSTPSTCFDSAICTSSGWYWYSAGCWSSPQTTTSTSTSCPSGQYWDGHVCVTSTTTTSPTPTTTTCPSGQYWNGTSCVASTPPPSSFLPNGLCPKNHSWNGSYCIVRKQSIAHFFAQTRTSGWQFMGALGAILGWK